MVKRIASILLAVLLIGATAVIGVSAAEGTYYDPKPYVPSDAAKAVGFNRYFFLMPDEWSNEYTSAAGIYWWDGTDACGSLDGAQAGVKWPGYLIYRYNDAEANVWYCDVPVDAPNIVFNNGFDGGDVLWDNYDERRNLMAYQTVDIGSEYYDYGESDNYPDGTENFNNMIYVIDPSKTSESVTGKKTYGGEWYYYHGDGKYDTALDPKFGGAEGEAPHESEVLYTVKAAGTDYNKQDLMHRAEDGKLLTYTFYGLTAGEYTFTVNDNSGKAFGPATGVYSGDGKGKATVTLDTETGEVKVDLEKAPEPSTQATTAKPDPQTGATSKVSTQDTPSTTTAGNGTVATGSASFAVILLVVLASVAGVAIVIRKREFDK